jgi:hypothetical protein
MRIRIEAVAALALMTACRAAPPAPPPRPPEPPPPREFSGVRALREQIRELSERAAALKGEAHAALDAGKYDDAAQLHRQAVAASLAAEVARVAEEGLLRAEAKLLIQDLDHEEIAVREAATRGLVELGASPALILELGGHLTGEAARRVQMIVDRIEKGFNPRQWASGATASSEYSNASWSAAQATGEPDTPGAGDHKTAWASREADGSEEWLTLTFDIAVVPTHIRVHETFNAGAIVKVEVKEASGSWRTVWEGEAKACEAPHWFEAPVPPGAGATREIRLTLDSAAVRGWNEIDAVELVGRDPLRASPR